MTGHYQYVLRDAGKELTIEANSAETLQRMLNSDNPGWGVDFYGSTFSGLTIGVVDDAPPQPLPPAVDKIILARKPATGFIRCEGDTESPDGETT